MVRVDAQLSVGALTERIEVTTTATAELQTERADVHAEITTKAMQELPQANRAYLGLLQLVPGVLPPGGQLSGGTNNPSKGMSFAFNGSNGTAQTVRIEGINGLNPWNRGYQSYVPSVEAIQNVNIATNANDAEQGIAGGASVNVMLKSGSNETHGGAYLYNINSAFEANNFFANSSGISKPPHLVDNNFGGFAGGHIIRNKLFYFGSYEVDLNHSADSAILSFPNHAQLGGDMSGSGTPIYDPLTGKPDGTGKIAFPGNIIPTNRIDPVTLKIIPNIPQTNIGGAAVVNNYYTNRSTIYNLHKIDTKLDYNVTSKLRVSGRFGYQPYYNFQTPFYGEILGGSGGFGQSGAGKLPAARRRVGGLRVRKLRDQSDLHCRRGLGQNEFASTAFSEPDQYQVRLGRAGNSRHEQRAAALDRRRSELRHLQFQHHGRVVSGAGIYPADIRVRGQCDQDQGVAHHSFRRLT